MADLAQLQAQLEKLKNARRMGASRVSYEGKSVDYRSDGEMQAAIAGLEHEIATAQGTAKPRMVVVRSDKGW